ncbi:hypothetical protein [Streptomyces sp. NPDC048636]|uniref:hypothetical protein n=1 Tax=Streptomyces sp. NPDC048636 TaxID=3155762 RepID=UPI003414C94B
MPSNKVTLLRIGAPVAILALALTGCGSHGKKGSSAKSKKHKSSSSHLSGGHRSGAKKSRPATSSLLRPGQSASRAFREDTGVKPFYRIAAQKVDIGTNAEAKALVSDPADAKGKVPAVVYVTYTHVTGPEVPEFPRVGDYADVLAGGRRGTKVIGVTKEPKGCADADEIKNWKDDQSYTLCNTFLVPEHPKSLRVTWTEIGGDPFTWKFS